MLSQLRSHRPSHVTVVAYLALFVALGGSSYAAIKVTGKNVKDSSLTGQDLKNESVTGTDVRGLTTRDFTGRLPAGADGAAGPQGAQGVQGGQGLPGQNGSPDTAQQVLDKLKTVDGSNSLLDSDLLDGQSASAFLASGAAAGGDLAGQYPNPTIMGGAVSADEIADGTLKAADTFAISGNQAVDPPILAAHTCTTMVMSVVGRQSDDLPLIFPTLNLTNPGLGGGNILLMPHSTIGAMDQVHFTICNIGTATVDAPAGNWRYVIIRRV